MGLSIELKSWNVRTSDKGEKNISGSYQVMSGAIAVAKQPFNDETYGSVAVPMPPELLVEALALDTKIKEAISKHYGM